MNASREDGAEINLEETEFTLLSRHQNAGRDVDIKMANRLFENVTVQIFWKDGNK
jgi:hypothetical protein